MTKPYSLDLRERVVEAVLAGGSCRSVAARFGVAVSSVVKWARRYRETGSVARGKMGGHRRVVLEPHRAMIIEGIERVPHLTVRGLRDIPASRGITVSRQAVWRFPRSQGLSFKKNLYAVERARAAVARRRRRWQGFQARLAPERLVFIDETWIKANMAPLRGWGPRGKRLIGFAPHGKWRAMTFLAALRHDRLTAPCVFDGPINGACFFAYVEQQLVLTLTPGDIVIVDTLANHKSKAVRDAVKAAGARLRFLPSCSPDLTPPLSVKAAPSPVGQ